MAAELSLAGFAALLTGMVAEIEHAKVRALREGAEIIETEAKRVIGTYEYGWPQLAEATKRDRVAQGFAENDPLLRTGEMRESISHTIVSTEEAQIGSDSDVAVYQELGTTTIPARSFLAGAAVHKADEVARRLGAKVENVMIGNHEKKDKS